MRNIKFRGKRVDNGEWVYGCFVNTTLTDEPMCIGDCRIHYLIIENGTMWHVDPDTVGQYTGKRDIDNNNLYDGDIYKNNENDCIGIVEYFHGDLWGKEYKNKELYNSMIFCQLDITDFKIIGNIYDNLEMVSDWY